MQIEDTLPTAITAHTQVAIVLAMAHLRAQGQRFCIDFGWGNAIGAARWRGWDVNALPLPLLEAALAEEPDGQAEAELLGAFAS